jgi:type II secretion system protein C
VELSNFQLRQNYIAALNLGLIGITVYFLALAVSNGIKLHLAKSDVAVFAKSHERATSLPVQVGLKPRNYYDTIAQRDIFSLAPVVVAPPPVENEKLDVTLIGTSHLSVGKPFIIVETPDGDQSLYRQGETIPNVGRVLSIGHDKAIVLHNGHRVALQIPDSLEGGTSQPSIFGLPRHGFRLNPRRWQHPSRFRRQGDLSSNAGAGVERVSSNRYAIGRDTLDRSLSNMNSLFAQIRAMPNLQNGSAHGFRLSQIQPGSIFQQIGLEDGDILTGAQGQTVNDPMGAMALFNSLRSSPSISLSLIRNGSPMQLYYTIH